MPYAIVPAIPHPAPRFLGVRNTWLGFDAEAGWNGVRLSLTRALVWHPTVTLSDPRAIVLGDNGLDVLSAARRARLAALHPDRTFGAGTRLRNAIADLLRRPVPGGFPALLPHRSGRYEILCGPGEVGENRLWEEATEPDGTHSQDLQDTFNRSNGNVDGSTSSDSQFTWSLVVGTSARVQINSNEARATRSGSDQSHTLLTSVNMDTINHYAQITLANWTTSGSEWGQTILVVTRARYGTLAAGDEGYNGYWYRDHAGAQRGVYDPMNAVDLPGASDTTAATVGDVMYLEWNGSSYVMKRNGSTLFSGTDTTYSTYKRVGIGLATYGTNPGNNFVAADNYRAADLVKDGPRSVTIGMRQAVHRAAHF